MISYTESLAIRSIHVSPWSRCTWSRPTTFVRVHLHQATMASIVNSAEFAVADDGCCLRIKSATSLVVLGTMTEGTQRRWNDFIHSCHSLWRHVVAMEVHRVNQGRSARVRCLTIWPRSPIHQPASKDAIQRAMGERPLHPLLRIGFSDRKGSLGEG